MTPLNVQVENPMDDPLRIFNCSATLTTDGDIEVTGEVEHTAEGIGQGLRRYNPTLLFYVYDPYNLPIACGKTLAGGEFLIPGQRVFFTGVVPGVGGSAKKVVVSAQPWSGYRENKKKGKAKE